jgi:WD40 repeat protein
MITGQPTNWPSEIHILQGQTGPVHSGTHIVSGSQDNTIRVWNATTGQLVAGPFQGYTDPVWSVAYHLMGPKLSLALQTTPLGYGMQPVVSL